MGKNKNEKGTWFYAKIFLLMIIPAYGLFFTLLLAFGDNVEEDIRHLSRGALIARSLLILLLLIVLGIGIVYALPYLENFFSNFKGFTSLFR